MQFNFQKEDIGDITVFAYLSNLVSSLTLKFEFTLIEVVQEPIVKVQNGIALTDLKNDTVDVAVLSKLIFLVSVSFGSHLDIAINYGDGQSSLFTFDNPLITDASFEHQYTTEGIFSVTVATVNNVSSSMQKYVDAVNVFEVVDDVVSRIQTVRFEQEDVLDIFVDSSELFALAYGSEVFARYV